VARPRWLLGSALALLLMATQAPLPVDSVGGPERSVLPNGITVVTRHRPGSRVVAIDFAVRAGARYEVDNSPSAAHLLEHALLLGTERRPTRDELLRTITSRGGQLSTGAGREILEVSLAVGLEDLGLAVDVLEDVVTDSRFDEEVIAAERLVILQELDERDDDPATLAADRVFDTIFAGHPLRRRPSGSREGVRELTVPQLREFWRSRLIGDNIVIAVVSGLEHGAVVERLGPAFGALPAGPPPARNTTAFPLVGPESIELAAGTDQAHVYVAAPLPGWGSPDRPALRIMRSILSRSSGRLYTEIRDRRGLAYSTYASVAQYSDGGLFYAYAGTEEANTETVVELLKGELARLRDVPLEPIELRDAIGAEVGSLVLGEETSSAEAVSLARNTLFGLPPREVEVAELRAVTAGDVQRVARRYLDEAWLSVVVARPAESLE
jgi:predicted Zn-dependent peptidase